MTEMRKPRIGLLNVSCPTHREAKNETGDDWINSESIIKIREQLKNNGLDLVEYNKIVGYFYELEEAEKLFFIEDVDAIFVYISTWN